MKLRPLGKRVVIKVQRAEDEKTASGIILDAKEDVCDMGDVLAVCKNTPIRIGDKALLPRYGLNLIEKGTDKYYVCYIDSILGVIRRSNADKV